jgi:hypothetical protein
LLDHAARLLVTARKQRRELDDSRETTVSALTMCYTVLSEMAQLDLERFRVSLGEQWHASLKEQLELCEDARAAEPLLTLISKTSLGTIHHPPLPFLAFNSLCLLVNKPVRLKNKQFHF